MFIFLTDHVIVDVTMKISVITKILILTVLPLCAYMTISTVFLVKSAEDRITLSRNAVSSQQLMSVSDLILEVQKERGQSFTFLLVWQTLRPL